MTTRDQRELRFLLERGDIAGFVARLEPLCHREASRVAANGIEHDDLVQEARIAAWRAGRNWTAAGGANPLSLAVRYIQNELWKATRGQLTDKRRANHEALSLDTPVAATADAPSFGSLIPAPGATVHEIAEQRDDLRGIAGRLSILPDDVRAQADDPRSRAGKACALVARGATVEVIYVKRRSDHTPAGVMAKVVRRDPAVFPVSATAAPAVWRVEVLHLAPGTEAMAA